MAGKLLEVRVNGCRIVAPPDVIRTIPALLPELQESVRAIGEGLGVASPRVPPNVFVVPLYYAGHYNPVRLFDSQLHLDERYCSNWLGTEYKFFTMPSFVLPAFFWYDRYRESDGYAPHFLADFYAHLYKGSGMSYYLDSDDESVLPACREAAQEILRLEREGKRPRLEQAMATWYQQLAQEAAGDVWQDLHTILLSGGKIND